MREVSPVVVGSESAVGGVGRRGFLGRVGLATAGLALSSTLTACSQASGPSNTTTFGLGPYAPAAAAVYRRLVRTWESRTQNVAIVNASAFGDFQSGLAQYLTTAPDDVFVLPDGENLRFSVKNGLLGRLDRAADTVATSQSGHFAPLTVTPHVVLLRRSVWSAKGWKQPTTVTDLVRLGAVIKRAGLVPLAFAGTDPAAASAVFDQLDLALNGIAFHRRLLQHTESWRSPEVTRVLALWRQIRTVQDPAAAKLDQRSALAKVVSGQAAMVLISTDALGSVLQRSDADDFDFFAFPSATGAAPVAVVALTEGIVLSRPGGYSSAGRSLAGFLTTEQARRDVSTAQAGTTVAAGGQAASTDGSFGGRLAKLVARAGQVVPPLAQEAKKAVATIVPPALQTFATTGRFDAGVVESGIAAQPA